jgi:hypothetical protein
MKYIVSAENVSKNESKQNFYQRGNGKYLIFEEEIGHSLQYGKTRKPVKYN